MITLEKLLKPDIIPEAVFSAPGSVEAEYKDAAKRFHPDVPTTGDKTAFQVLSELRNRALEKIKIGEWQTPGLLVLKGDDGKEKRIRYLKDYNAGIGKGYIGKTLLTFVLPPDLSDLAENARAVVSGFENTKYPNDKVKADFEPRRARLKKFFKTVDGKSVLVIEKPEDVIRLRDVSDHYDNKIDPKHIAWIMSEMHNASCWLEMMKLTHNDLSMDSIFICPRRHSAMILGGWWFATPVGSRMQRIQVARTVKNLPRDVSATKIASIDNDLGQIRLLGRELLGDESGLDLIDHGAPLALSNWLRTATTGSARQDYKQWVQVLTKAFGERRFVNMSLKSSDIYKE